MAIKKVIFWRREYIDRNNFIESQLTRCFVEHWYSSNGKIAYFRQNESTVFELDADMIVRIDE